MNKIFTLNLFFLVTLTTGLYAQKEAPYAQKAADIQAKIWGDKAKEFDVKVTPANYAKESAVIIAQYTNVEQASSNKLKMSFYIPVTATRTSRVTTFRQRVKLNDKAAIDDYSSLSYQKSLDNSQRFLYMSLKNKQDVYIGAKIIKADGKEIIVNTSEEVLTQNTDKDKQGKLAIPGLEVGDILDYYVCKIELLEDYEKSGGNSSHLFVLAGEYPILSYQLNLQYNKKMSFYYVNANNAPEFTEGLADNGDKTYKLKLTNLPKLDNKLWTSELRQYPYIEMIASFNTTMFNFLGNNKSKNGENRLDKVISSYETMWGASPASFVKYKDMVKDYFGSSKAYKAAPLDSTLRVLYDTWKYNSFANYDATDMDRGTNRNKLRAISKYIIPVLGNVLKDMDIDYDILLVSSRNNSSLENVFSESDLKCLIRINGGSKPLYMCFDNVFTQFNEIPMQYQGEDAIVLSPHKGSLKKYDQSRTTIPVIPASENYAANKLNVSFLPANMQKIVIERSVNEAGALRGDQADLMISTDYLPVLKDVITPEGKSVKREKTTKLSVEIANANAKAKEELTANFKNEIAGEFGQEPQNLSNCHVTNVGISNVTPEFSYTGKFEMDNFVKRAGNNYIFEIGKLIGVYNKIDEKQRDRQIDVYMPCARTLSYDITVAIPKGYQIKGVDELNRQLKNESGSLNITAKVTGGNLMVRIVRSYTHNFEKVAQWPKILAILDGMGNFNNQKVLFEKI